MGAYTEVPEATKKVEGFSEMVVLPDQTRGAFQVPLQCGGCNKKFIFDPCSGISTENNCFQVKDGGYAARCPHCGDVDETMQHRL